MELITIMYLYLGGFMVLGLVITVFVVAGREMFFAFYRRFVPKGSEVYLMTPTRHVNHHYKTPKDGVFEIGGVKYIINPDKQYSLKDAMHQDIKASMDRRRKRLEANIAKIDQKQEIVLKQIHSLKDVPENVPIIDNFKLQVAELENSKEKYKGKLKLRDNTFYMRRRGCYFYVENDPIPKDWYELFSEMDGKQLENIIMRAQTKDAKHTQELEKQVLWIKRFIMFALIASAVGAWFAFNNNSALQQLAESAGVTLTL